MAELIIVPVLVLGVILGLYELFSIHADMNFRGSHWFGHGLHAIGIMIIALFATMNTVFFLEITGLANIGIPFITSPLILRILVGLILVIKMHSVSAISGGGKGLSEKWTHVLIISALVVIAPYVWPFIAPLLPNWLSSWTI